VRGGVAVFALAAALLAAGCGTGGISKTGDSDKGKKLFLAKCGGCHTLAAAGTSGTTGPNLDQNLKGQTKGFINESIVDPNKQIAKGYAPNIMPQNFETAIKPDDLKALVAYLYTSTNGLAFTEDKVRQLARSGIDEVTMPERSTGTGTMSAPANLKIERASG
jgi:mono/diheme cytochrome c family protein